MFELFCKVNNRNHHRSHKFVRNDVNHGLMVTKYQRVYTVKILSTDDFNQLLTAVSSDSNKFYY